MKIEDRNKWEANAIGNSAGATVAAILIWTGWPVWLAIVWPAVVSVAIIVYVNWRYTNRTEPDPEAVCPECGELNRTHYSGSTEREGKRLGISRHNPFPERININIPDSSQHALEKAATDWLTRQP